GPINLSGEFIFPDFAADDPRYIERWLIVGGESGGGARPMHPTWGFGLQVQCVDAGVPFFFKQWGEGLPESQTQAGEFLAEQSARGSYDAHQWEDGTYSLRVGKRAAGRLFDGREWNELPVSPLPTPTFPLTSAASAFSADQRRA